ncbi:MAG: hypothetical protein ABFS17_00020 [Chloroflexota bacterium]
MNTKKKQRVLSIIFAFILLFSLAVPVLAQTYAFRLDRQTVHAYWESDGTLSLQYEFVFSNESYADPIDYVDVGMPNENFSSGLTYAEVNGTEIYHITRSAYVEHGIELGLGSMAIPPGQTGTVYFEIDGITDVLYFDSDDDGYASAVFSPTWFGSEYVNGSTDLTVIFHLPPGLSPDVPRWHKSPRGWPEEEPVSYFDDQGRIVYEWRNLNANGYTQYLFGASFPAESVPSNTIIKPTFWENIGIDPDDVFAGLCVTGFLSLFIAIPVISIRSSNKRKLKYLPPKLAMEGHGIKRGLTSIQAAILLEQPMEKIMTMVLFAVVKKGAAKVTKRDPLELEIIKPKPEGLRGYELDFLAGMKETAKAKRSKTLQAMMVQLVKSVTKSMKGFSQKETRRYYEKIIKKAWSQVEASDTPQVKSEMYEKVMEWTMLDDNYDDRTRRTFQDTPVFLPTWWGSYSPSPASRTSGPKPVSAPTSRPTPGGTRMPQLPGSDFAASVVTGVETFASSVVGNVNDFTSGVTKKTNPLPKPSKSSYSSGRSSGGGSSCACACACAGCACACAGGGR